MAHSFSAVAANNCFIILAEGGENNNLFCRIDEEGGNLKLSRFYYVYLDSTPLSACMLSVGEKSCSEQSFALLKMAKENGFCRSLPAIYIFPGFLRK
jgi:hypothetical protein